MSLSCQHRASAAFGQPSGNSEAVITRCWTMIMIQTDHRDIWTADCESLGLAYRGGS